MYAQQRQKLILERIESAGRAAVSELAADFELTPETIRRDLSALAEAGLVERVHGGAVAHRTVVVEPDVDTRHQSNMQSKQRIAEAVAAMIDHRGLASVILDAGTTTGLVAMRLSSKVSAVITNDPAIVRSAAQSGVPSYILPGRLRKVTLAAVGSDTVDAIQALHADVCVMGANGMTAHGFTTPDPEEASVKRAFVHAAQLRIVAADSTKAGVIALRTFAALEDIDVVVTDAGLPHELRAAFEDAGIDVVIA
ncbi:MAG: DeoR/GlpR family DNA-binding transcription regulator [Actinomycetaceae bacterium]|nr:DeoR/GlpR family DNA-binding transcription regulator [Actinomycetaceae bacterium]MDY6083570.1 DeoR/GlpR family DNA-binding transcription regulator [Actinomycetaceae bacterium]